MTLVIDHREQLQGRAGLHAVIVGVSAYDFLPREENEAFDPQLTMGLRQLSSTALSAFKVFCWLQEHQNTLPVPLATVRLLLSPTEAEQAARQEMEGLADPATRPNFDKEAKAWRADAAKDPRNVTFFYFAGHGAQQTPEDALMLMADFGNGEGVRLSNAVDISNIYQGMAASDAFPTMAQTQLYFVDACRDFLPAFRNYKPEAAAQIFDVQLNAPDDNRIAPIFFASVPGRQAYARIGQQTLFSEALLRCLSNDAGEIKEIDGEDRWYVSVHSLSEALTQVLAGSHQHVVGGMVRDALITFLEQPPSVQVSLEVIPADAVTLTHLEILDNLGHELPSPPYPEVPFPLPKHPYECVCPAGTYMIRAIIEPPDPRYTDVTRPNRKIMPPIYPGKVRVTS